MKNGEAIAKLASRIELWGVDRLQPYLHNARTHSDEQVSQIAASIREFGFTNPILVDSADGIIAGHGRLQAAKSLGLTEVPVIVLDHLTDEQRRAYILADNKLAMNAGWDDQLLAQELSALKLEGFDLDLVGFSEDELNEILGGLEDEVTEGNTEDDAVPEVQAQPITVEGDIWILGKHRVMCGDSTSIDAVEKLMDGKKAQLLHADPPYGMGKASDGVANDNLYEEELDRFQMEWWATFRTFLTDKASAYIWGNAPELWRLWYCGGLSRSEHLELRNQIVWDKKHMAGMKSADKTQYVTATEHCLFFNIGKQYLEEVNSDKFPDDWEPIRSYLFSEAKRANIKADDIREVCGVGMYAHWFTKSQFQLIPKQHYKKLQKAYPGSFTKSWENLDAEWQLVTERSYFDNAHDIMRDVWEFPRVVGDDRHGHATPKPVAMMERVMKSSLPKNGICAEPFGGSGATLIGAEKTGRICYTMELQPKYVDVIVRRWQDFTGKKATLEGDGRTFDDIEGERVKQAA